MIDTNVPTTIRLPRSAAIEVLHESAEDLLAATDAEPTMPADPLRVAVDLARAAQARDDVVGLDRALRALIAGAQVLRGNLRCRFPDEICGREA